jgi:hypothetical protein
MSTWGGASRPFSFIPQINGAPMVKFEYTASEDHDEGRVYVRVDDIFDIRILRTEEGLIIDVYEKDEINLLGTIAIDEDSLSCNQED